MEGKKLWSSKLRREREITFFLAAGAVKKNLIKQDLKLYPKKITSSFIHYFFQARNDWGALYRQAWRLHRHLTQSTTEDTLRCFSQSWQRLDCKPHVFCTADWTKSLTWKKNIHLERWGFFVTLWKNRHRTLSFFWLNFQQFWMFLIMLVGGRRFQII